MQEKAIPHIDWRMASSCMTLIDYTILAVHHLECTLLIYLRLAHLILRATSTRCNCKRPIRSSNFLRSSME